MTLPKPMSAAAAASRARPAGSAMSRSSGSGTVRITASQSCTFAVGAADATAPSVLLDGGDHAAEMDRSAMAAALRRQKIDQRAIAAGDARPGCGGRRPSIRRAAPACWRARDRRRRSPRPCARWPRRIRSYSGPAKCRRRNSATVRSSFSCLQRLVQLGLVRIVRRLRARVLAVMTLHRVPSSGCSDSPASRSRAARHRRVAMDEFGAAFRGIAELGRRQRIDAAAAAVARFQDRHLSCRRARVRARPSGRRRRRRRR